MTTRLRTLAAVPAGLALVAALLAGCNNGAAASSTPSETMMTDESMSATPTPSDAMMDESPDATMTDGTDG